MKVFKMRPFILMICASGIYGVSISAMASAFQLWEQDAASLGNYHAGYAAEAYDASTSFYNPAGLTRFKNQQIVFGADAVTTSFKYQGTVATSGLGNLPMTATAQGGVFSLIPFVHYVAPLTDCLNFGFSVVVPFGLKTSYGVSSPVRYAATLSSITVVDYSPSLAYQFTHNFSLGAGLDIQTADAKFNSVGTLFFPENDTSGLNQASDTGYGGHLGALYAFSPTTRAGISYHSQVRHHLTGTSRVEGPIADIFNNGPIHSHATANITLPAYTAVSFFQQLNPKIDVMGSIIYTQWNVLQNLTLKNVSGLTEDLNPSTNLSSTLPLHFQNTWNLSLGANYAPCDSLVLRAGLGYDQTPVQDAYRNVRLPDNDRYVIALGGHYQATKTIGIDLGWNHLFMNQATINPPAQVTGATVVTTNGNVTGGADVIGGQIVWDIA